MQLLARTFFQETKLKKLNKNSVIMNSIGLPHLFAITVKVYVVKQHFGTKIFSMNSLQP
jgi:hypothetical protein